jgi:hypothetical protein
MTAMSTKMDTAISNISKGKNSSNLASLLEQQIKIANEQQTLQRQESMAMIAILAAIAKSLTGK